MKSDVSQEGFRLRKLKNITSEFNIQNYKNQIKIIH